MSLLRQKVFMGCLLFLFSGTAALQGMQQNCVAGTCACGPGPRLVGYYVCWNGQFGPDDIQFDALTHVAHAFIWPGYEQSEGVCTSAGVDEDAGCTDFVSQGTALMTEAAGTDTKVLVAVGGGSPDDIKDKFSAIAAVEACRQQFAMDLKNFCNDNGYDGAVIDWEFPKDEVDKNNQTELIREIHEAFNDSATLELAMAVSAGSYYGEWNDYAALVEYVSFFEGMTFDYHGCWSDHTGHNSPIFDGEDPCGDEASWEGTAEYLIEQQGIPYCKFDFGIPFYGLKFEGAKELYDEDWECDSGSDNFDGMTYSDIVQEIEGGAWIEHWDAVSLAPYLTKDNEAPAFLSYDNEASVFLKADYALRKKGVGGTFVWYLGADWHSDSDTQPLMNEIEAAYDALPACVIQIVSDDACGVCDPVCESIQGAIDLEYERALFKVQAGVFAEDLVLDEEKQTWLYGGWDCQFKNNGSVTTVQGSITVRHGAVIVENVVVE